MGDILILCEVQTTLISILKGGGGDAIFEGDL
jgi:hypothetical protein